MSFHPLVGLAVAPIALVVVTGPAAAAAVSEPPRQAADSVGLLAGGMVAGAGAAFAGTAVVRRGKVRR